MTHLEAHMRTVLAVLLLFVSFAQASPQTLARPIVDRAIAYLRTTQDETSGGWSHRKTGPNLPAITGLVVDGMLMDKRIDANDPAMQRAIAYILSFRKPDGTIHDGMLPSYNTAICLSALSRVHTCDAAEAIKAGQDAIRAMQWQGTLALNAQAYNEAVDEDHPYFGGVGYGKHSRPDLSNLGFAVQALHDTGVSTEDPAFERALVFLRRTQMLDEVNEMAYADGSAQGGFIYATVPDAESVDSQPGQSQAGTFEEVMPDGSRATRLRAYGSMTYVGFKSLIYADLAPEDPRVQAALGWIERNWTLDENPGMSAEGQYYYYAVLARALDAFGRDALTVRNTDGETRTVQWREELIAKLGSLQESDGSFRSLNSRWMEDNADLITAYALIALEIAGR
jgi:squalene-hopene/tetraprenyl-beta-curcumene cyclase